MHTKTVMTELYRSLLLWKEAVSLSFFFLVDVFKIRAEFDHNTQYTREGRHAKFNKY